MTTKITENLPTEYDSQRLRINNYGGHASDKTTETGRNDNLK